MDIATMDFLKAKKELEQIHNSFCTQLRQEFNRFNIEVKNALNGIPDMIREEVKQELTIHVTEINRVLQNVETKINTRYGG